VRVVEGELMVKERGMLILLEADELAEIVVKAEIQQFRHCIGVYIYLLEKEEIS